MLTKSATKIATASFSALLLAVTLSAQTADSTANSTVSKVRIVRLSQVKGEVQLDRDNGRGFERAIANIPVVEKSRLKTGTGVAEIEFEDNSSLRVAPDSIVEFPQLERLASGATVSSVRLVKGTAYASLMKTPGNQFSLLFGEQSLSLPAASHVRLELQGEEARLAVLDGTVHIESPSGAIDVPRKKSVTFEMNQSAAPTVAKAYEAGPFDTWDHNEVEYHSRSAAMSATGGSPYSYGASDMSYYGGFANYSGCGSMWRPYFASAGWDPYGNGAWAWYQGAGYSWVSPYPWGWTPYHYGSWSYCQGAGWGWMPGGSWMGLNNMAAVTGSVSPVGRPVAPIKPPRAGEPLLTAVNLKPPVQSEETEGSFVFRKDSAGLGIPRDELGNLEKFSQHAIEKGTASTEIYRESLSPSGARTLSGSASLAMTSMHRGSPPAAQSYSQNNSQGGPGRSSNLSNTASSMHSSAPASPSSSSSGHH